MAGALFAAKEAQVSGWETSTYASKRVAIEKRQSWADIRDYERVSALWQERSQAELAALAGVIEAELDRLLKEPGPAVTLLGPNRPPSPGERPPSRHPVADTSRGLTASFLFAEKPPQEWIDRLESLVASAFAAAPPLCTRQSIARELSKGHQPTPALETFLEKIAALCRSASLEDFGRFVGEIDAGRLSNTDYVHVLAEVAVRAAGCSQYAPAESFDFAAGLAERVRGLYDPSDADQTLDFIRLMTAYLRPGARGLPVKLPAERLRPEAEKAALIWLDAFLAIEARIDPTWTPGEEMPAFESPKAVPLRPGTAPESIRDPEVRSAYEAWLARRRTFLERQRAQALFRQALETRREAFGDYFREIRPYLGEPGKVLSQKASALRDESLRRGAAFLIPGSSRER